MTVELILNYLLQKTSLTLTHLSNLHKIIKGKQNQLISMTAKPETAMGLHLLYFLFIFYFYPQYLKKKNLAVFCHDLHRVETTFFFHETTKIKDSFQV